MQHSVGFVCLPVCVAALWLSGVANAPAQESYGPVKLQVDSIVAQYVDDGRTHRHGTTVRMDPRLNAHGVADRLRLMFDYTDYHLVRRQAAESNCGGAVAFNLPGGHILHVAPVDIQGGELAMDLAMFEGAHQIMRLPFRIIDGGMLMLLDQHEPNRFYITTISAENPKLSAARRSPAPDFHGVVPPVQPIPALVPAW